MSVCVHIRSSGEPMTSLGVSALNQYGSGQTVQRHSREISFYDSTVSRLRCGVAIATRGALHPIANNVQHAEAVARRFVDVAR